MKYKNLKFSIYFVLVILMILPVSCLKDEDKEARDNENRLIQEYVSQNTGFVAQSSGMYYRQDSAGTGLISPVYSDMVIISYNASFLETKKIFDTSDTAVSRINSITNYTLLGTAGPLKISLFGSFGFYSVGVSEAITKMKEGGGATIVVPGSLALGNFTPLIFNVKLLKIISNPRAFEMEQISKYLATLSIPQTLADSIGAHSNTSTDSTGLWQYGTTAGIDSIPCKYGDSVDVKYSLKLLPYVEAPYLNVPEKILAIDETIKIKLGYSRVIPGFTGAVSLIKKNGKASVVIPFHQGYDRYIKTNSYTGQLLIPQYSTLIYDLELTRVKKNN